MKNIIGAILKWSLHSIFGETAFHVLFSESLNWANPPAFQEVGKNKNILFEKTDKDETCA